MKTAALPSTAVSTSEMCDEETASLAKVHPPVSMKTYLNRWSCKPGRNSVLKLASLFFVAVVFMLLGASSGKAAARTASVSGNWSSTATWGGQAVPVAGDTVTINVGVTVTVDISTAVCASVVIGSGNGTATLTFATTGSPRSE